MEPKQIILQPNEWIVAVVPEKHQGPGWANVLIKVYIGLGGGGGCAFRAEYIQPGEQTAGMLALFGVCEAAHRAILGEVLAITKNSPPPKLALPPNVALFEMAGVPEDPPESAIQAPGEAIPKCPPPTQDEGGIAPQEADMGV